jgi:fermentation-respiration switch protein FrsA (DUF1100 family)
MVLGCVAAAVVATSCVRPTVRAPKAPEEFERYLTLYDHLLALHCARPVESRPGVPLLLYATGDGGWRGKDRDAYRRMIYWGYPVAGFSAPDYLKHLGFVSGTTTPARLARDYRELIEFARTALRLPPATRAVLVGVSRGAGLAVVAASRSELHDDLAGVLAVALTKEEEYVRHYRVRRGTSPSDMPKRELVEFQTYASLHRLTTLPLAVIQSTADGYLSAADARQLFGPDTERRRFFAIEARDHSFGGAREALYGQMEASLAWICHFSPSPEAK